MKPQLSPFAVPEEMIGAYLEGNLTTDLNNYMTSIIEKDSELKNFISEIKTESIDSTLSIIDDNPFFKENFQLPNLDFSTTNDSYANFDTLNGIDNLNSELNDTFMETANPYQQTYLDTCAIKSQQLILNDFGIPATEDELVQYSYEKGWYHGDGTGTSVQDVGNLLEEANIPCTRQANANVFNLVNELAQGHKVIVGVDSGELWGNKFTAWFNDFFNGEAPDHALIVSGIDTSDPDNIKVLVTDPGTGDHQKAYPLDQFMDAWSDSNCYMVSTDISAPEYAEGMQNFDQEIGHIPDVAGLSYTDFQIFNDISMGLPTYMPIDSGFAYPMSSLTDAYFDYANNNIAFNDIFSDNYLFNNYLDYSIVNEYMRPTCFNGFDDINWSSIQPLGTEIPMDFNRFSLADMGVDYNLFYNDCINQFRAMGDFNSMELCQQQLDIMGYCDCNSLDYSTDFLMFI